MKAGGNAKPNASLEQGAQVSMATKRAATTTRQHHYEKLRGDTHRPLYSPRGRGGALTASQMSIWSSKLHGLPEQVFIIWCVAKTYMLNRGAWSANTTDQHWFNFNLSDDIYLLSQMHETFDLIFSVPKNVLVTSKDFRYFRNINEDVPTTFKHFQMHL